jgi:2-methylisocitrate lyase-like PEP mutase family enzyme
LSMTDRLRNLLAKPGISVVPGCYDAVSAKLIEKGVFQRTRKNGTRQKIICKQRTENLNKPV